MSEASTATRKPGLPPGRTYAEALERAVERRCLLWRHNLPEDWRIDQLNAYCVALYRGDEEAGRLLAQAAIWA